MEPLKLKGAKNKQHPIWYHSQHTWWTETRSCSAGGIQIYYYSPWFLHPWQRCKACSLFLILPSQRVGGKGLLCGIEQQQLFLRQEETMVCTFPVDFKFSPSPVLLIFPRNRVRECFLRRAVHQSWLPITDEQILRTEECLHSVFWTPACHSAAWCSTGSSRKNIWSVVSADFQKVSEGRRLLLELDVTSQVLPCGQQSAAVYCSGIPLVTREWREFLWVSSCFMLYYRKAISHLLSSTVLQPPWLSIRSVI